MITLLVALYLSPVCVNIPAVGFNDGREKHVSSRIKLYEAEPPPSLGCQPGNASEEHTRWRQKPIPDPLIGPTRQGERQAF
ncbi:hypothetical protein ACWXWE_10330 [Pantoea ananatis]|uniref:hypothetical protein n=1 Tax=Pantoea ananas TaxID=553 RepID=UPI00051D4824|nr:hypothetical protein [Pantoea ananatis]KGL54462.1 hypothetical protein KR94_12900 [Pantoea ananatis]QZE27630.1 hypothetical protein K4732_11680 [Pantoea ananatis]